MSLQETIDSSLESEDLSAEQDAQLRAFGNEAFDELIRRLRNEHLTDLQRCRALQRLVTLGVSSCRNRREDVHDEALRWVTSGSIVLRKRAVKTLIDMTELLLMAPGLRPENQPGAMPPLLERTRSIVRGVDLGHLAAEEEESLHSFFSDPPDELTNWLHRLRTTTSHRLPGKGLVVSGIHDSGIDTERDFASVQLIVEHAQPLHILYNSDFTEEQRRRAELAAHGFLDVVLLADSKPWRDILVLVTSVSSEPAARSSDDAALFAGRAAGRSFLEKVVKRENEGS